TYAAISPVAPFPTRRSSDLAPIAAVVAVVAVVAHHQVVPRRDSAAEPAVIVNAVLLAWKRPYVQRIHGLRRRVHRNGVLAVVRTLAPPFGHHIRQAFEVAVRSVRSLRQRHAVDRQL